MPALELEDDGEDGVRQISFCWSLCLSEIVEERGESNAAASCDVIKINSFMKFKCWGVFPSQETLCVEFHCWEMNLN